MPWTSEQKTWFWITPKWGISVLMWHPSNISNDVMGTQGCLFATWCEEVIVTAVHSDNVALKKNFPLSWKPIPTTKRLNKTNNTMFWIIFKIGSSFLAYILPPILGSGNKSPGHTLSKLQIFGTAIILILLEVFNKLESLGDRREPINPKVLNTKLFYQQTMLLTKLLSYLERFQIQQKFQAKFLPLLRLFSTEKIHPAFSRWDEELRCFFCSLPQKKDSTAWYPDFLPHAYRNHFKFDFRFEPPKKCDNPEVVNQEKLIWLLNVIQHGPPTSYTLQVFAHL